MITNRNNFFRNTFAIFNKVEAFSLPENANYSSKHGSKYFFTKEGVYRYSNHWGRVGNCRWRLEGLDYQQQTNFWGFARWTDFFPNDEMAAVFFIESIANGEYLFNHKGNASENQVYFRTAKETAKVIQKLKEMNESEQWAKYLPHEDYDVLKQFFINELISTNKTFLQIQREYLSSL